MANKAAPALNKQDIAILQTLAPGTVVDLQIDTPTAPQRLKTFYVGMDIPNGFIFQVPNSHKWANIRDQLVTGNSVVVRFVIEGEFGQVIAFKVDILKCFSKPISILITDFPSTIQSRGLRAEKRSQPGIPVSVLIDEGQAASDKSKIKGLIVDVSKKGCKLAITKESEAVALSVNKNITLGCKLDGETIKIEALVKNITEDKRYRYHGIQFSDEQGSVDVLLERHILLG
ncbi:PilZ domain-containing protein [Alteromonas sp. C1M14]|uniref:flagellar brake domain-containing protein n=1 Tax=Alteromonas sp. C1M14 TaxID=2841567 RepID=UPI001C08EC40|nr:PilZ domain-containing protein [Alteromonas sp. C1M14]MBU2976939.1 flagellar brake protein [Alteromonas sp. C1M14]